MPLLNPAGKPSRMAPSRSWVTLKATTDQVRYAIGQPIQVRLVATNTFKRGAYLRFSSGQRFDFAVYPVGKSESVYTWSATRMFMQSTGFLWLTPGRSQSYEATIGDEMGQLKPGKYRLVAYLANSPRRIAAAPVEFEVAGTAMALKTRTDKATYKIGEPVQINVAVSNHASEPTIVNITSGMACDMSISDEAGNPIWSYGANLRFIRVLGDVTWQAGETKTYSATWNGVALPSDATPSLLKPGRYQVKAVLQSATLLQSAPITIEITR